MGKKLRFTGLGEHQYWCGDDREHPALVILAGVETRSTEHFAEMRCVNGDVVEFDRLGNAQAALDQGVAVLIEDAPAMTSRVKKDAPTSE